MKLSCIVPDNVIVIDGVARNPVGFIYPPGVRAVQWDGTDGFVEYDQGAPQHFSDVAFLDDFVEAHADAPESGGPTVPPLTPQEAAQAEINSRLAEVGLTQEWQLLSAMAGMIALGASQGKTEPQTYTENTGYRNAKNLFTWITAKKLEAGIEP